MKLSHDPDTAGPYSDTRRQPRIELYRPVRLFEPFSGASFTAVTCNVSAEGVCLQVLGEINLQPGRYVTLHGNPAVGPRLSGTNNRATSARVVWTAPDPTDPKLARVGLQLYVKAVAVAA